ncbi:unnamed protein product [Victoria cruziana]
MVALMSLRHTFSGTYTNLYRAKYSLSLCVCVYVPLVLCKWTTWRNSEKNCSLVSFPFVQYDFQGRKDLVKFVKTVAAAGLYVHLRIGPYVCAEWNYGGFPLWLHFVPGIEFRTDNEPFKAEMQRFTSKIVQLMKQEQLFASQGGPIILSQIENEYGNIDSAYGPAGKSYINWAASMATAQNTGVPWVMCQQADAPDPIINTCNGFYCDQFTPNSNQKPKMWTENWVGWFLSFGGRVPYRPVEDIAFAVARFFQRGGCFQNYYMYQGGTNFGRTSGGPFIATSYDYDAPVDEYGVVRQPKWGHLKDLHSSIKLCEDALVAGDPTFTSLGPNLEAHVYRAGPEKCAAFLANVGTQSDQTVTFNGNSYHLPAWSVSILPDCKNVVFNSAKINSQVAHFEMTQINPAFKSEGSTASSAPFQLTWSWIPEPVGISKSDKFERDGLLEQINTTADLSDYLWYSLSIEIMGNESFLVNGTETVLHIGSLGHALHAFINGKLVGSGAGNSGNAKVELDVAVVLKPGNNVIDLLSVTVGLQNYGAFFDKRGAGITGPVTFMDIQSHTIDLSKKRWTYQVGLKGEKQGLSGNSDTSDSQWISSSDTPINQPLIWYKANFDVPDGDDPIALDLGGLGKGEAWVNGQSIGRYWPSYTSPQDGCSSSCNYRGTYDANKCLKNCGLPSQRLYHVPRSWMTPKGNTLVLFEEVGGDPTKVFFAKKTLGSLCAQVSESHPVPVDAWESDAGRAHRLVPELRLECPKENQVISSIRFASFGTPKGTCGNFSHGRCSSRTALDLVSKACSGLRSCKIAVSSKIFGDPCSGVVKNLAVEVLCSVQIDE